MGGIENCAPHCDPSVGTEVAYALGLCQFGPVGPVGSVGSVGAGSVVVADTTEANVGGVDVSAISDACTKGRVSSREFRGHRVSSRGTLAALCRQVWGTSKIRAFER